MEITIKIVIALLFLSCSAASQSFSPKGLTEGLGLDSEISHEEMNYSCKPLPASKPPAQMSSGEGVPPLPLPAVPQRRTEKKNPPRPPVLVVKIITDKESDWNTNPQDIENLLKWMAKNLGVNFSSQNRTLDDVFGVNGPMQMAVKE